MTNLQQNPIEEWKDIPGYEGYYKASSLGRIRAVYRLVYKLNASGYYYHPYRSRILNPFPNRDGYLLVDLCNKTFSAHNVIAKTFLGPKPNGQIVMHINNNKKDNRVTNLKYGTYSENSIQAISDKLYTHGRTGLHGSRNPQSKAVRQIDIDGNIIAAFESTADAAKKLNLSQGSISNACKESFRKCGGYHWQYI
jgi:hypothetical protein